MAEPRITLYTTPWCPYCVQARRLLEGAGLPFTDHDVASDRALRRRLTADTGWRTVPMVFVDGELIGGFTELSRLHAEGGLDPMISAEAR